MTDAFTVGLGPGAPRPRLLDMARKAIRRRHFSYRAEQSYLHSMKRFILFSGKRHPAEMDSAAEVTAFPGYLVVERQVFASTPIQVPAALLFLYKEVIGHAWRRLNDMDYAKRLARRPFVRAVQLRTPRARHYRSTPLRTMLRSTRSAHKAL